MTEKPIQRSWMSSAVLRAIFIVGFPAFVFFFGSYLILHYTGRDSVSQSGEKELAGLHMRMQGYNQTAATDYWKWLERNDALVAEQRFLRTDIVFPFFYAGAILISILLARKWLKPSLNPIKSLLTIAAIVLADWTENLLQLQQMNRFVQGEPLQSSWIQVASIATILKWVFAIIISYFLLKFGRRVFREHAILHSRDAKA